jgi:hypothetical protein
MAAHKVDAMAAIARANVGFRVRWQCCGSDRIGVARCGQRRRGRDGDRLLGGRRLRAYRDCMNGLRHVGKLFRDRNRRRAVKGLRQHSKIVRNRARRCQQIRLLHRLISMTRRSGIRIGTIIKCYPSRKRESGYNHTKYRLRGFHSHPYFTVGEYRRPATYPRGGLRASGPFSQRPATPIPFHHCAVQPAKDAMGQRLTVSPSLKGPGTTPVRLSWQTAFLRHDCA